MRNGCFTTASTVDVAPIAQELVCRLHRHPAKVGDEMGAVGVAGDVTLRAFPSVLAAKR